MALPPTPLDYEALAAEAKGNEYLELHLAKVKLWGSWLLAQWATCGAVALPDFNAIDKEKMTIRGRFSWSVPTKEALDVLAAHAPLLEIGAGNGYWAGLLHRRRVDLLAFDTAAFDKSFNDKADIRAGEELVSEAFAAGIQQAGTHLASSPSNISLSPSPSVSLSLSPPIPLSLSLVCLFLPCLIRQLRSPLPLLHIHTSLSLPSSLFLCSESAFGCCPSTNAVF